MDHPDGDTRGRDPAAPRRGTRRAPIAFAPLLIATAYAAPAVATYAASAASAATAAADLIPPPLDLSPRPELRAGPGAGFRTGAPGMLRALSPTVRFEPILSAGDTLTSARNDEPTFTFPGLPQAIAIVPRDAASADVFVAHDVAWQRGYGGAVVSRLRIDLRNGGVLAADYFLDGSEWYSRFASATLTDSRDRFLRPTLFLGEGSTAGPHRGVVAAIDVRNGTVRDLPWLGGFAHRGLAIVPVSSGRIAAVMTERTLPGQSQIYLYLADSDSDFLEGHGQLHVLRADPSSGFGSGRNASAVGKGRPIRGRFTPITIRDPLDAAALEAAAQGSRCISFVRPGGVAIDRERSDAFYFTDSGDATLQDFDTGALITGNGRLYHVSLDPFDPTRVEELSVVLDGDGGDDLYRPEDLATDQESVIMQENPRAVRGLHPSRVQRYDVTSRRLEAIAECAERDRQGRLLPPGVGGAWATHGIVNASDVFGTDSWLLVVQARTLEVPQLGTLGEGGQLLLLRGPRYRSRSQGG